MSLFDTTVKRIPRYQSALGIDAGVIWEGAHQL